MSNSDIDVERRRRKAQSAKGAVEHRVFASRLELRDGDNGELRLLGYASVTDTAYEVGGFTETIRQGAFKRTLSEGPDVQLLIGHEGLPLARTKSGTLRLAEDERGLKVDADLDADDTDVQRLVTKMRRGDVDAMSFAFRATDDEWSKDYSERTIRSVSIHRGDVSVVAQGANTAATAALRSREAAMARRPVASPAMAQRQRLAVLEWRAEMPRRREVRAATKYGLTASDRMAKSGRAMPDGSYPIADAEDLSNAIRAVGRGGGSHNAIRRHIIKRARALGLSSKSRTTGTATAA